jgi:hypothetical protein
MQTVAFEIAATDAEAFEALAREHPDAIDTYPGHGVDGTEWMTFAVEMTKALAPHLFALLTVLVTTRRKVVVIQNGKRRELTEEELQKLKTQSGED